LSVVNEEGETALTLAAKAGHQQAVRALIACGVTREKSFVTQCRLALYHSITKRHFSVASTLHDAALQTLGHRHSIYDWGIGGNLVTMCLLHDCAVYSGGQWEDTPGLREDIFSYLDGLGLIELVKSKSGNRLSLYSNPLLAACALHIDKVIVFLLEKDFHANLKCFYTGYTPILAFVAFPSLNLVDPERLPTSDGVDALVRAGADLTALTPNGHSVLTLAAYHRPSSQIEQIMRLAPSFINQTNRNGQTPLMAAVIRELLDSLELDDPPDFSRLTPLVAGTADLDARDSKGNTALHYAAEHDNKRCDRTGHNEEEEEGEEHEWEPVCCILLFAGAQSDVRNNAGQTFLDLVGAPLRAKILATASQALANVTEFGFVGLATAHTCPYSQSVLVNAANNQQAKDLLMRTFCTRVDQAVQAVQQGCQENGASQTLIGFHRLHPIT